MSEALATMPDDGAEALAKFDPRKYIVLHPVVHSEGSLASPVLVQSIAVVQINPDEKGPDVFKPWWQVGRGDVAFTANALRRISAAAGMRWEDTQFDGPHTDATTRHKRVTATAAASVRQPNGEWYRISQSKEIDSEVMEAKWTAEGRNNVPKQILILKEQLLAYAESKAMNRVIRALLTLQQQYPAAQLAACPIVVPRLLYRPDMADPMVLEQMHMQGRRASADLYGTPVALPVGADATAGASPDSSEGQWADESPLHGEGGDGSEASWSEDSAERSTEASPGADTPGQSEGASVEAALPESDPKLSAGPHKDKHVSQLAQREPDYLMKIATGQVKATPTLVECARQWLVYYDPSILEGEVEPW